VARYRKTAIAALAASALLLTPSAAYAHDLNLGRILHKAPSASSMSWANYRGELTDYPTTPDVLSGAKATAMMMGLNDESTFRLSIRGIDKSAAGKEYPAHLHVGPCVADDPGAAGGHYNISSEVPPLVSEQTEVHLDFTVNDKGSARITVSVPFVPTAGTHSIVIHSDETPAAGSSPTRLACLPLEIQTFPSTD
jgi:Cu/Zn superoxide dismutase